ncbi:hypothetical protein [Verminephrobacter aporrectodeae]|uniref:hypothetical protein n=1 Tax=Verminephrobacter aporrectodeae TaxID=1110389 RepID=UPI0022443A89|nr:hypothetical protein [Verminephrobacter aporrectodeae]
MSKLLCFKAAIAWMVVLIASASWAQCGVTQDCSLFPPAPTVNVCSANLCFRNAEARREYEQRNNCTIFDGDLCASRVVNAATQCCVMDSVTQISKIQQKQYTKLNKKFNWDIYSKECTKMQQSQAKPDELWAQCKVGQKHSANDDYPVVHVEQNGSARTYCIDGCSTPPGTVKNLTRLGVFIFPDRDNPSGAGLGGIGNASSFFPACSEHDKCYQTCNSNNQQVCDKKMLSDMTAACERIPKDHITTFKGNFEIKTIKTHIACMRSAKTMHMGLEKFGSNAFSLRRQQYCQCCE